ncbi:hypothetical protein D3C81_1689250 [compost metagenome]
MAAKSCNPWVFIHFITNDLIWSNSILALFARSATPLETLPARLFSGLAVSNSPMMLSMVDRSLLPDNSFVSPSRRFISPASSGSISPCSTASISMSFSVSFSFPSEGSAAACTCSAAPPSAISAPMALEMSTPRRYSHIFPSK